MQYFTPHKPHNPRRINHIHHPNRMNTLPATPLKTILYKNRGGRGDPLCHPSSYNEAMARLYPFRALRYDPTRVNMTDVVTQPYDKITPAMQDAYYAASPYNLIRVILGKHNPTDTDANNVYTRAAATLNDWRAEGILKEESEPALYGYAQTYTVPGTAETRERRGFIALGQLHDYADKVVYRHEQTFPKHKSDRLALFKATRAYCEQIYMLYSDPTFTAEKAIFESGTAPELEITDEYNVLHRVWKVTDPTLITRVLSAMDDKWLLIADGHHRYETSTTYMQERAAELGLDPKAPPQNLSSRQELPPQNLSSQPELPSQNLSSRPERSAVERPAGEPATTLPQPAFPEAAMMMTFVNMDAPGITILPTHRVAFGLIGFNGREFAAKAADYFTVTEIPLTQSGHYPGAENLLKQLNDTPGIAFIAATRDGDFLLTPKLEAIAPLLANLSPRQQQLDVTQLHKVVLEKLLGLNEETIRAGQNIRYLREASDSLQQLGCGNADVAFLIKPVTLDQMKDISLNLEVMPQKSTDFYPKLLSGLAMYTLD
jgi:uncharacterized protein (DUF1015 family)